MAGHLETNFTSPEGVHLIENDAWDGIDHPFVLERKIQNALIRQERFSKMPILERNDETEEYAKRIISQLETQGINIEDVTNIQLHGTYIHFRYMQDGVERQTTFYTNGETSFSATEFEREERLGDLVKSVERFGKLLAIMEHIFTENSEEWFKFLDEDDVLDASQLSNEFQDIGEELHGQSILDIQLIAHEELRRIDANLVFFPHLDGEFVQEIHAQKIQYQKYIFGIGDRFEGGADLFEQYSEDTEKLMSDIVNGFSSDEETLDYLLSIHTAVGENWKESASVNASYTILIKKLNQLVFSRIRRNYSEVSESSINEKTRPFIRLIRLATGRQGGIDSKYQDASLANEIALFIMGVPGGIVDKIQESSADFVIEDPEVTGKNPSSIVTSVIDTLNSTGRNGRNLLETIKFEDILGLPPEASYQDLTIQQKIKISTLARLEEKIKDPENAEKELKDIFVEIAVEANNIVAEGVEENFDTGFWGKSASEYELTGENAELFDLFCDIHGSGLFDLADSTKGYLVAGANIAGVIAVGAGIALLCVLTAPAMGVVAIGAAVGFAATAAAIAISDDGYDSLGEAARNISIELAIGTGAGALGGYVMARLGIGSQNLWRQRWMIEKLGNNLLRNKIRGLNSGLFALDLAVLGIGTEVGRQVVMDWLFPPDEFFDQENL